MEETKNKKIVVCDLDNTISDSRSRAKKYLFEGNKCDSCGRIETKTHREQMMYPSDMCGRHEGSFGITCRGKMVKTEKDWTGFFASVGEDKPMFSMIAILNALKESHRIVFVTSRNESCREATLNWIVQNVKLHPVELYMRAEYDRRQSDKVKKDIISYLLNREDIAFAIDDDLSTIEMYKEQCQNATIIDVRNYMWDDGS